MAGIVAKAVPERDLAAQMGPPPLRLPPLPGRGAGLLWPRGLGDSSYSPPRSSAGA